jgi:DNA polymerase-3 subunit delta
VRLSPDALASSLGRGLRSAYLVTGTEPLLIAEACDALRQAARQAGFGDREVHFVERGFDWGGLLASAANLSLFASQRLIELRLGGAADAEAQKMLAALATSPPADAVLLVTGQLDRRKLDAVWVKAFETHGALVVAQPVEREALPRWITGRLARHGLEIDAAGAELLADRVEGNLLAAQQEVERIALLLPAGPLDAAQVASMVADSARYDVFELAAAALAGDLTRALRILAGLRGEGQEPPLVLWALVNELRGLSRVMQQLALGRPLEAAFRTEEIWSRRQGPLRAAIGRLSRPAVDALLLEAARADRVAKGSLKGDPWVALEALVARMGGVSLAA